MEFRGNTVSLTFPRTTAPASLVTVLAFDPPTDERQLGEWLNATELLVCWAFDPSNPARVEQFWTFLERCTVEAPTEELFRACLGLGFAAAREELVSYATESHSLRWSAGPASLDVAITARDATRVEIARLKGEWERLETRFVKRNQPELEPFYRDLARRTLQRSLDRGDRDPRVCATLGLLELESGNRPAAEELLAEALAHGVKRPRVGFELARLRYDHAFGRSPRNDGKFTEEQADGILEPLVAAARLAPPLPGIFELMIHVAEQSAATPTAQVLATLAEGAALYPRNSELVYRVAALHAQFSTRQRARELTQLGLIHATKQPVRHQLLALAQKLAE